MKVWKRFVGLVMWIKEKYYIILKYFLFNVRLEVIKIDFLILVFWFFKKYFLFYFLKKKILIVGYGWN